MSTNETAWYELIGKKGTNVRQLVGCDTFASAISLKELADVVIFCAVPMVKMSYQILDRNDSTVTEGSYPFPAEGTFSFPLKDALPLDDLKPYETENADYAISITVTLISGDEVSGSFAFRCNLHPGETTTEMPCTDLIRQLEAIPIANASMTEEELRQICLDYIRLETEFPFKFKEDFTYVIFSQKRRRKLLGGKVYAGLPYVTRGAGNLYRIAEIYDPETGTLDASSDIFNDIRYFGNACSGAASMAWARVVTSAYLGYTMFMTQANGFLPVGSYRYPKENVTRFNRDDPNTTCCKEVCAFNGPEAMYECYAQMKPADGLVTDGHVRMNSAVPTVVRNPDGTIDPDRSFTYVREQTCYVAHPNHMRVASDGSHYVAQGRVDYHNTFRQLFAADYLPFTFPEFKDPSRVEPARIRLAVEPELRERVLSSNYAISDVFLECNGRRYVYRNMEFFRKELKMSDIFPEEALTKDAKITCRLYNGQLLEVPQ